jgi:hypothetical protein
MFPSIVSNIRRNWRSLFGLALVMAVGPMCGSGGGGGGGVPPAPTTFSVVLNFPGQNALNVARTQTVYLTVNGVVDAATLAGNVTLIGTNPIPANLTWNPVLSQIEITPQSPNFMESNVLHTVNVGAGVKTVGGASMVPRTITFTTINSADTSVPTFAGATTATPVDTDTITLSWAAGNDGGGTPVGSLIYDVYLATTTGQINYATPPLATSAAGATSVNVEPLASNTNYFFVVRCRDGAGNRDANTTERSGKTRVAFATDIYNGIINNPATGRCTTCHRLGGQSEFMRMDLGASDVVVNKWVGIAADPGTGPHPLPSCGGLGQIRVIAGDAANSLVWKKVAGTQPCGLQMPEDGPLNGFLTGAQIQTIADWINQGAPNN